MYRKRERERERTFEWSAIQILRKVSNTLLKQWQFVEKQSYRFKTNSSECLRYTTTTTTKNHSNDDKIQSDTILFSGYLNKCQK